jgi:hypothetical protein
MSGVDDMKVLSAEVQRAWERFETEANLSSLHPLDEDRLYQFLVLAYDEGHSGEPLIRQVFTRSGHENLRQRLIREAETASGILDVVRGNGRRA